jgi:predicted CoA-substrate-specific enzyme activase
MEKGVKMNTYRVGIDIGSTTAKVVVLNEHAQIAFSAYRRHHAEILGTLQAILQEAFKGLGNVNLGLLVTGSAGLGISEKFGLPFIQEVVASAEVVKQQYPQVKTLIDIGGEDAKMIFFSPEGPPDIRMNGSCAGGTGAFIDEMATLLNLPVAELDALAGQHTMIYPMASRCGVFAKTDLQNLLSRKIARADIAASVFHAVVLQTLATLARGYEPAPQVLFSGGPLTFLPALKATFMEVMKISPEEVLEIEKAELLPAMGAALAKSEARQELALGQLISLLKAPTQQQEHKNRLAPLFENQQAYQHWEAARGRHKIERAALSDINGGSCFLGVDSGSTTTKLVLIDSQGRVVFDYYASNRGNAIQAVQQGLEQLRQRVGSNGSGTKIARSVVTGYGEDLIQAAFGFDDGMVETLAHFRAARAFDAKVSFILDIGGQDMKAIFVKDGNIQNIEINEACSSGCGSFIESFARSMGYDVADFARLACTSEAPCDLGTRCTVFMNSRVKQALREGAEISDISAGLAYSVIKNALHKVLKITDTTQLGEHIVVQGGTFRNPAVHKALEALLGQPVVCPDLAELMGAYGAALTARDTHLASEKILDYYANLDDLVAIGDYVQRLIHCHGCENRCAVSRLRFPNGNSFFSGNRCEKIFNNGGKSERQGINLTARKYELLFSRETETTSNFGMTVGIPRVLNQFENFPFWQALFSECGIRVELSSASSNAIYEKGAAAIMSENLCFPAKLVSGHVFDLIERGVDRIFYPMVFFEQKEFSDADNCFNCPVVSGYADVIRSVVNPAQRHGIPFDMLPVTFNDPKLLKRICYRYLSRLGVNRWTIRKAFRRALEAQAEFKQEVRQKAAEILATAEAEGRPVILLLGRPYHIDPLINHKIPDLLTQAGLDVITEDAVPLAPEQTLDNAYVMTQWEFVNRYYHAARWAGQQKNVEVVQLNSFGCGPDAYILDEVRSILAEYGKSPTVLRIDEIESPGSTKLRLRSMVEALKQRPQERKLTPRKTTRKYQVEDRRRTIIVPDFSPFCSPPIIRPFLDMGFEVVTLPPADRASVETGLKYANNEICYPGIVCLGDLVKALQSGKYDPDKVAVGFSQTGGQCRATSIPSLIKKALVAAGFEDVPVVTLSTALKSFNDQPGLDFNIKEYVYKAAVSMMFTDALSELYYATAIRETKSGEARKIADKYLEPYNDGRIPLTRQALFDTLTSAVKDFNAIATTDQEYPKAGIVGEIYVKYNAFSNNNVAQWLMSQGVEVVLPPMLEFFSGGLISIANGVKTHIKKPDALWLLSFLGRRLIENFLGNVSEIMADFRYHRAHHRIQDIAQKAQEITSLNHQYGEGWLIAGEIASFVKDGVNNVLCLQPFGCIANHVVAKGVQKRIKELYPQVNLLFLDADAGVSEVNFFNRMHFFVNHAKEAHLG